MKITAVTSVLIALTLTGCGNLNQLNGSINDSANQLMGRYVAPTLASSPTSSGCSRNDSRCQELDEFEAIGYEAVRKKKTTWTEFVNMFYEGRKELYPNSNDSVHTREFMSFQRVLAEQLDLGKITEAQWAYPVDKKYAETQTKNAGRQTTCDTQNTGTNEFPNYRIVCR